MLSRSASSCWAWPAGFAGGSGSATSRRRPDPGWSANEASRIRAAAAPGIWLVLINASNRAEGDSLLAAVAREGGARRDSLIVPGGRAVRMTFD